MPKNNKFTSKKRRKPNTPWLDNALRSVGYMGKAAFTDLIPNISHAAKGTSEVAGNIAGKIKNANSGNLRNAISENTLVGIGKRTIDRTIQDLKSGKFYNPEREEEMLEKAMGLDMSELDPSNWNFDDDVGDGEGDVNFTYVEGDSGAASETTAKASLYIADTVKAGTEATIQASKANIEAMASIANTGLLQMQQVGNQVLNTLGGIDNTLSSILHYHEENTTKFYETAVAMFEKFGKTIEEEKETPSNDKVRSDQLFSDGKLDFNRYKDYVKQRAKSAFDNTEVGSLAGMIGDPAIIESMLTSPIHSIGTGIITKLIPEMTKETLRSLDKTFKDFVPSVLARIGDLKDTQGNDYIDGVKRAIGEIFGLDPSVGKNFQLSGKVTKEAATFDKVTRNAIVEVLPRYARESTVYLRMIAQSMKIDTKKARESEDIYDYANNKYTSRKEMRKNIAQDLFTSQISGYQGTDFYQALRAGGSDLEGEASKRYQSMMNQMLAYITQAGKNLTVKDFNFENENSVINSIFGDLESKDRHDKKAKGTLRETLKLMRDKNININEITADQLRSKATYNDILRRMSEDADEYGLIAAGLDEDTDVFKFIDEELGFGQRRRNEEERKRREEIAKRGSKSQRRQAKREERKKNRRREDKIAFSGLQNGQLIDDEGRSDEVSLYESNGLMTAAVNAAGHVKNSMVAFMRGDSDGVVKEFSAIFTDSLKNLFNKFKESFITPAVESLFGKKNAEGYKEDGLLAGAQNSIKDTWKAVNLRLTGKGYIDSKGEKHSEASDGIDSAASIVKRTMKDIGESIRTRLFGSKDKDDGTEEGEKKGKGIVGGLVDNMKEGLVSWKNALFGTDDKDVKESVEDIKKRALDSLPSASVGAVGGAIVGQMTGGLLGSLIGGPVTGAVLGVTTSFLAKNEKFQRYIFGEEIEDENGNKTRVGGLVSQRTQEFFKDPENKKMIVGGAALGLAKSAILGSSGGYLGMLVGGPVAGMILGAGMGLLKKSKMFNTFLYGDEETGKTGIIQHIKNLWSKNNNTDENGKKSGVGATLLGALGLAGGGALLGSMIAKHGILGASLSAAGPIGGAILGLGLGIKLGGKRFQNLLFGEKDEEGKRKGGLFSKMANWMHVEVIAPMKSSLLDVGRFLKDEIEFKILEPLRISVEPLGKMFLNLGKKFMDRARSTAGKLGSNIKENLIKPFLTIAGNILSPLHTMVRTVSKVAVSASLAVVKMPVILMKNLATIITNPFIQLGKAVINFLVKPIKGIFGFAKKAITAPFKALGKVLSFGAALSIHGANKLADRRAGLGRILGRDRYEDNGTYGSENARLRKEKRDRKRERNQQRRIDQNLDYNRREMARATGYELKYFTKENMEKVNEDIKEWNKTHKFKDRKQKIKWHGGENMTFDVDPEAERKKRLEKLGRVSNDGLIDRTGVGDDVDVRQLSETSKVRTILQNLASFFMGGVDPLKVKISELKQRRLNKKREEDGYTEPTEDEGNEPDGRTTMERYVDEMDAAGGVVNWFKKKINDKFGRKSHLGGENDMSNVSQDEAMEQLRNDLNEEDTPNDKSKGIKGRWKDIKNFFGRHNRARAEGGSVTAGQPTLVGDGGKDPSAAEIIVPNTAGKVLSQKGNGIRVFVDGISTKLLTQLRRTFTTNGPRSNVRLAGFSTETTEDIQNDWDGMDTAVQKSIMRQARKAAKKGDKGSTKIGTNKELALADFKAIRGKEEAKAKLEVIQNKGSYLSQLAAKNEAKEKEENKNLLTQIAKNTGEQAETGKHGLLKMISHFKEWGAMFGKTGKIALGLLVAIPIIKAAWPAIENILNWLKNFDLENVLENVFKRFGFSMKNSGGTDNKKGDNEDGKTGTEALGDQLDDLANFAKEPSLENASNILIDEHTGEISANAGPTLNGGRGLYQYGKKKLQRGEDILTFGRSRTKRREKRKEQRKESWENTKARTKKMTGWSKNQWKDIPRTSPEYWTNIYGKEEGMKKFNEYKMDKLNFADNIQEKGMTKRQAKAQMRKDQLKRKFNESKTGQKVQNLQKKGNKLLDTVDSKLPAKAGKGEKGILDYALKKEGYTHSERVAQQNLMKSTTMGAKDTMVSLGISDDIAEKYVQKATTKQNNKLTTKLVTKVKNTKAGKAATEVAGKSKGLLQKFIGMFKSAIDDFVEAVGKKLGGKVGSKGLKTGATKGLKGFVNGAIKIIEKKFPKIAGKVAAILGGTAAVASTGFGVLAVLGGNVAGAIMFGINEMSNPRSLFRVSADTEVDWIMTAIATTIGALKGTTAGAIFDLVFSLIETWTESTFGVVPWTWIASTLYNLICNAIGDNASYDKLVENQQKFENDYEDYKEGEYQKQYKSYLKSSGQDEKSYSYDQYKQDVMDDKLTVSYSSKADYNAHTNKTLGRKIGDGALAAVDKVKGLRASIFGSKKEGYVDVEKNLFYQKNGDVYEMYNVKEYDKDGNPVDVEETGDKIHVDNIDTSKLKEAKLTKKGFVQKAGSFFGGIGKKVGGFFSGAKDKAVDLGKSAVNTVKNAGTSAMNFVKDGFTNVKDAVLNSAVVKGVTNVGSSALSFIKGEVDEINVGVDKDSALAPVGTVLQHVLQTITFGPRTIVKAVKAITGFLSSAGKFVSGFVTKTAGAVGPYISGKTDSIDFKVPEDNPAKGIIDGASKVMEFFAFLPRLVVGGVKNGVSSLISAGKIIGTVVPMVGGKTLSFIKGDSDEISFNVSDDNPAKGLINGAAGVLQFFASGPRMMVGGARKVFDLLKSAPKAIKNGIQAIGGAVMPYIKGTADSVDFGIGDDNPIKPIMGGVSSVLEFLLGGPRLVYGAVTKVISGIKSAWSFGKKFVPLAFSKSREFAKGETEEIDFNVDNPVFNAVGKGLEIINTPERFLRGVGKSIIKNAKKGIQFAKTFPKKAFNAARSYAKGEIDNIDFGDNIIANVVGTAIELVNTPERFIRSTFAKVTEWFGNQIEPGTTSLGSIVGDYIHSKSDTIDFGVKDDSVLKPIFNVVEPVAKFVLTPIRWVVTLFDTVKQKVTDTIDSVKDVLGGIFDFFSGDGGEGGEGGLGGFGSRIRKSGKKYTDNLRASLADVGGYGPNEANGHPYYAQTDERWGEKEYNGKGSKSKMKDAGCGPSAIAMVASRYKGNITPEDVAKDAVDAGYRDKTGTNAKFVSYEANKLGLTSHQKSSPSAEEILATVDSGNSMILNGISNGEPNSPFTTAGHYVVAVGKDKNGNILINDPRGEQYNRAVAPEELAAQTRIGWNFRKSVKPKKKTNLKQKIKNLVGGFGKKKTGKKKGSTSGKDWIGVVRSVHKAMSDETNAHGYEYSASSHNINVDGKTYSVRWDCSGFVSACLQVYGSKPKGWTTNAAGFATKSANLDGFTYMSWPGWNNLQEGDIMARSGHTEIFAGNKDGGHYVYNAGSTNAIKATSPTRSSKDSYTGVWRPNNPGQGVELVTSSSSSSSSDSATASIDSSSGTDIFSKITNVFDQYVSKATTGVLTGKWDYNYSDPSSTDTGASVDNNYQSASQGTWATSTSGKAKTKEVPPGFGKTMSYMHWGLVTSPSATQTKLRKEAGWYDDKGMAKVGDRYAVAVKPYFGSPGDYLDVKYKDGTVMKAVVGDQKGSENEPGKGQSKYINMASNQRQLKMGVTNMVHADGSVVEYIIDGKSEFGNTPKFAGYGGSRTVAEIHPEWKQNISTITKVGNYWKDKNKGGKSNSNAKEDTKSKDTKKKTNSKGKGTGGKGEEIGGYGAGATVMKGVGNMTGAASLKKTTSMLNSMEGNMNKEFTKIEKSIDTKELGGYGPVKAKGQKATVEKRSVLRSTKSSSKQKEVMRKELETEKDVKDTLDSVKKEQSGVREKLDQICGFLQTIAGNTAGITPAIKQINLRGSVSERSTSQKNKAEKEMGVSGMESQAPSFGNSKNAKLAVELARG